MTGDQLRLLIRSGVDSRLSFPGMPDDEWDDVAEAVLAAFAARGIVLGEAVKLSDDDAIDWTDKMHESSHIHQLLFSFNSDGLALVRVVPNE